MTKETVLEVIVCSVADALEAERGGATRLEVVRDLHLGGLTPPIDLVREIKSSVYLPLRVMVRENTGFETSGEVEIKRMCDEVGCLGELGVDGVVIGFLKDGMIDVELTTRILNGAPKLNATFHHAFEAAHDKLQALERIKCIPQVDRILSHGGDVSGRVERLALYDRLSRPGIKILAGGGIDADAIVEIKGATGIREFHVGRAARSMNRVDGDVESELVRRLVEVLLD